MSSISPSFPAHKLCCQTHQNVTILFAATGPCIQSISIVDGTVLSIWPRDEADDWSEEDDERPNKRRKVDAHSGSELMREGSELSEASIEIIAEGKERQKGERRRPKLPDITPPNVSHLIASTKTRHLIAITVEDKAVRVFRASRNGRLRQLSSRSMPKKACAISLTADEQNILTADKFGDVYSVPLHPSSDYQPRVDRTPSEKVFKPSATELTVHTKGNLDALRQQQLQKQQKARKEGPGFEHKLLLGHVSLLTDLIIANRDINGSTRRFILTADRDEHIRVSRGIPQTHIIHSFCLGHTDFVSKLRTLPWDEKILVAGNGEPSLRVFDWYSGQEKARYDLAGILHDDIQSCLSSERSMDKLAVSGIWPLEIPAKRDGQAVRALFLSLEGLPLLFIFDVVGHDFTYCQTLKLEGNLLDVVFLPDHERMALCVDSVHKSGSHKETRSDEEAIASIQIFALTSVLVATDGQQVPSMLPVLERNVQIDAIPMQAQADSARSNGENKQQKGWERNYNALGELIYGLENLRKRRGTAAVDEDDEALEDEEEKDSPLTVEVQ